MTTNLNPGKEYVRTAPSLIDGGKRIGNVIVFCADLEHGENEPTLCFHSLTRNTVIKRVRNAVALIDFVLMRNSDHARGILTYLSINKET